MTAHALPGPIASRNALSCESTSQLHQLVQEVGSALGVKSENPAVYQAKVDAIAYLGAAGAIPPPSAVEVAGDQGEVMELISPRGHSDGGTDRDDDYSDADAVIRHHCESEWPNDFSMRAYCVQEQRKALAELRKGAPDDVPPEVFAQIRSHCAAEWPDDYAMRAYCELQQVEGYREVSDT